jgi:ribosomal protein L20
MENEKDAEARKKAFSIWRDEMRDTKLLRRSNRIGKNLSYSAFMNAWNHSKLELLENIINDLAIQDDELVIDNLFLLRDEIKEVIAEHEKV